jgi:hypothetical protein
MKNLITLFISFLFAVTLSYSQVNLNSIYLDGIDDYVEFVNPINIPNLPITIQADVKLPIGFTSNNSNYFSVFNSDDSNGNYYGFWCIIGSSTIEIAYGDGSGSNSSARRSKVANFQIDENKWVNIACVIVGEQNMEIYVDGINIGGNYSGSGTSYNSNGGNSSYIGRLISATLDKVSNGNIDNLAIWESLLNQQSIEQYIDCPPIGNEQNLVAFFDFENITSNTVENKTNVNQNGTLKNSVSISNDTPINNCSPLYDSYSLEYTEKNDYLKFENSIIIPTLPLTYQADIKLPLSFKTNSNYYFPIFKSNNLDINYYGFWINITSSSIEVSYGDGNGNNSSSRRSKTIPNNISENTWTNFACIIKGPEDIDIYIDGILIDGQYSGQGDVYKTANEHSFSGYNNYLVYNDTRGNIDNMTLWSTNIGNQAINKYKLCNPVGNETDLVAFFNFNEGTGITVNDLTSNNNTGTIFNGVKWSTDVPDKICNTSSAGIDIIKSQALKKTIIGYFDLMGNKIEFKSNTFLIIKYSDGTFEKISYLDTSN